MRQPIGSDTDYGRRTNEDGTVDSICRHCFLTIISSACEAELDMAEREHVCDPADLARFKQPHREPESVRAVETPWIAQQ